jgi:hypothetical protein
MQKIIKILGMIPENISWLVVSLLRLDSAPKWLRPLLLILLTDDREMLSWTPTRKIEATDRGGYVSQFRSRQLLILFSAF